MPLPVTSLYAALATLLLIGLAARIPRLRRRHQVGIGDGDRPDLALAVRVHANAAENIPVALLLLALLELQGGAPAGLHAAGGTLLLGRILHARGLGRSRGVSHGRFWGMALTWLALLGMALWLLAIAVFGPF
jgi:uncharacterized membrane protein YecN with MAPEG domain